MGANTANQTSLTAETTTLTGVGVNTLLPVDKIVKAHGLEAAGIDLGHDSVTPYSIDIVVRDPESGSIVDVTELKGNVEVGSPYERSQTTALPLTALLYDLGGINNPQANKAIRTAIEAAMMRRDGSSAEEVAAFYEANSVNWSADNNNGKNFLTMLRSSSVRLVKAAVKVFKR
jgi:hypothetical protein